jgi:hypothetical protein
MGKGQGRRRSLSPGFTNFADFLSSRLKNLSTLNNSNTASTAPPVKTYDDYLQEARNRLSGLSNAPSTGLISTPSEPNKLAGQNPNIF